MTNEEAKFMLGGYRPNGADAHDEAFAEALEQAARDPALRAWFEREQALDRTLADKLREIAPPAGLRESILAGTRLSTAPAAVVHGPLAWWQRGPIVVALSAVAAAAIVLLAVIGISRRGGEIALLPTMDALAHVALADFNGAHPMGPHADDFGTFGAWLENPSTKLHAAGAMPAKVTELKREGCRTISVAGHDIFEICFQRNGSWYHVYLAPRENFAPESIHDEPIFLEQGKFVAATWADRQFVYLVSGVTSVDALRALL